MLDVMYEYHRLAIIPVRDRRDRTAAEEERFGTLRGLLLSPAADVGERRWARVGLTRTADLVTSSGTLRARLLDAAAGGFRVAIEGEAPAALSPGEPIEVRVREKKRPTFAAKGGVVRVVEDTRAFTSTAIDAPDHQVAFEATQVGLEPAESDTTTYRFPCTVVWQGGAQSGLMLTGLPHAT